MADSLRVPDAIQDRVVKLAEAARRLKAMKQSGKGIPAAEVFDYLEARARGAKPARPKVRRLA